MNRRPKLTIMAPDASPEEAAAVMAAVAQFMRETAQAGAGSAGQTGAGCSAWVGVGPWQLTALREGVARSPESLPPWL
ncbi:MAG: hypothetical protein ACR2NR_23045 [Solirubrobacteraceae bacterium]